MASGDDGVSSADSVAPQSLAERLDRCFTTMHPADRGEWTYPEVSDALAKTGVKISASFLWQLRTGRRTNITLDRLRGLCEFFHVPVAYFVGGPEEVEHIDAQMAVVRAMRTPGVRDVALRASSLSPAGLRAIAAVIGELEGVQGMTASRSRRKIPPAAGGNEDSATPGE